MPTVLENSAALKTSIEIDSRSFHVFEYQGDRLLFDRATGTTSELNELAYDLLRRIRGGTSVEQSIQTIISERTDVDATEMRDALSGLQQRGFFRFSPIQNATEEELESLWEHKPRRIQLLMAEGCNLGCRYCYQWRNGTNQKHTLMSWRVARDAINHLVWKSGGRTDLQVTFFGGEPLLNYPMVKRVVEYCKSIEKFTDKQFTFELITNGTLLDKEVVDFIVEHKFLLFISLDGWKEMHEYNRPSLTDKDMHETIVKHALYANEQYEKHKLPKIKIRANLTNKYHDAKRVASYFHSLGFKLIGIGSIEPLPHGDPSPAAMTEDQMDELHDESAIALLETFEKYKRGQRLEPYYQKLLNSAYSTLSKRDFLGITCGVARNTTIVDNRGNMYPCHRYAEMKNYSIGNVFTGLHRQKVMEYYRKINGHATENCHECWIRDYCGGGCAWLLSDKDGNIHNPTARECNRRRSSMEHGLWLRKELRKCFPERFENQNEASLECWDWDLQIPDDAPKLRPAVNNARLNRGESVMHTVKMLAENVATAPTSGSSCSNSSASLRLPIVELTSDFKVATAAAPRDGGCSSCQSEGCGSHAGEVIIEMPLEFAFSPKLVT